MNKQTIIKKIKDNLHKVDGYTLEVIYWHVFNQSISYNEESGNFSYEKFPVKEKVKND